MTGRRMQSSGSDISSPPSADCGSSTFEPSIKQQRAVDDHRLAAVQALQHDGLAVLRAADLDRLHMRAAVDDREDEIAVLADLDRLARHDDRVGLDAQRQLEVAELPGPELFVGVVEDRARDDRAGRRDRRNCRGSRACPPSSSSSPAASRRPWRRWPSPREARELLFHAMGGLSFAVANDRLCLSFPKGICFCFSNRQPLPYFRFAFFLFTNR